MSQNLVRNGTNKEENNVQKDKGYRKLSIEMLSKQEY